MATGDEVSPPGLAQEDGLSAPAPGGSRVNGERNRETVVYLDHAATTPVRQEALEAWLKTTRLLQSFPGNPSALHAGGRAARRLLEDARERLAAALGADRAEVVFTSGATESAALGVTGAALGLIRASKVADVPGAPLVIASAIEHPAVAQQQGRLRSSGFDWKLLPVGSDGVSTFDMLDEDLARTALMTLCWVCSETGVIQPVEEMVEHARNWGFLVHSDATQAVGNLPVKFHRSGLDLMTIGGHKFGAPVGTGALVVKRGVSLFSDRPGGDQERKIRSGTQDVAGAVALAVAAESAVRESEARHRRFRELRGQLLAALPADVRQTTDAACVPGIVHLSLPTHHPEAVLLELDRAGIMASAGSACHAGVTRPSAVLLAMGRSENEALGVLRVSFGTETGARDVDRLLAALPGALAGARAMDQLG